MKISRIPVLISACLLFLAGCGKNAEGPAPSSTAALSQEELAQAAYSSLLSGEISLLEGSQLDQWGLREWPELLLPGEVEYTCLDLDGDGVSELLLQYRDDPRAFNAVFHYDGGKLFCWNNDHMEGNCRDRPLLDGTMVRQYDFNGTRSYTLFRYQADGETEEIAHLFAREELIPEDDTAPCPYYEVNGDEVDQAGFDGWLEELVVSQLLDRSAWTVL